MIEKDIEEIEEREEREEKEEREEREERGNFFQQFITNVIILCKPKLTKKDYKNIMSNFNDKLIFIKRNKENKSIEDYIPCLFYRRTNSPNYLIYFHGNSENIFQIEHYGLDFRSYLEMNVILVEYPGYFLKMENSSDPNIILNNSLIVFDWIKSTFNASDSQIFVCGRSLGTSPAIFLSSYRNPKALFLISAFTSIKNVGSDKCLSPFVEKIFSSINYIKFVKCPILFIHGEKDTLISIYHSKELYDKVKYNGNNDIDIIPRKNMTHNDFNLKEDIIDQINNFCNNKKLFSNKKIDNSLNKNDDLYKLPDEVKKKIVTEIFDINEFEINDKIEKKNASIIMNLPNDKIALVNDSKISIYNDRLLLDFEIDLLKIKKIEINLYDYEIDPLKIKKNEINLYDYEIDLLKIKKNEMNINNIYQMKNGNIICSCKEGDIFIFEKKKKQYNLINTISMKEEIYKLGEFFENYICLLSKNYIKIYDSTFSEDVLSYKNDKTFANFCTFSNKGLALAKNGIITIKNFENKYINFYYNKEIKLERDGLMDTLVGTDKYLIIGGMGKIYFYDVTKDYELESKELPLHSIINYISKIHDQFLLASTNKGSILQLVIKENGTKEIIEKYITNKEISYILMVNYEMIAISGSDGMDILSISHKEETENNKNCTIF